MAGSFRITGDPDADDLLEGDGFALIVGMLLDQQVPMEWAFRGPATLRQRLGHLDPGLIAARDVDEIVAAACQPPAIHRFPAVMARRIHAVSRQIVDEYEGAAEAIWTGAADASALYRRLHGLAGFGDEKTKIFIALLAKRFGHEPIGWEQVAAPFSDERPRSAADVAGPDTLAAVREWKRAQRERGMTKQD
ncbi:MAG TPA: HhH-GPD-type base excision DNA repair protein [Acidimicrobiia bacterium]|nr:HhH-GPD-type base excision DNA repair protein [Acidimicrobiia bacterium]